MDSERFFLSICLDFLGTESFFAWILIRIVFAWIRIRIKVWYGSGSVTIFQLLDPDPSK